jgi:hypothetical protein
MLKLVIAGSLTFAVAADATMTQPDRDNKCQAFRIGVSTLGGPDCLGGEDPTSMESLLGLLREARGRL